MPPYSEAAEQFRELFEILGPDILFLREMRKSAGDSQSLRRHYVRAVMAAHEGFVYAFKQMALGMHSDGACTSDAGELAIVPSMLRAERQGQGRSAPGDAERSEEIMLE